MLVPAGFKEFGGQANPLIFLTLLMVLCCFTKPGCKAAAKKVGFLELVQQRSAGTNACSPKVPREQHVANRCVVTLLHPPFLSLCAAAHMQSTVGALIADAHTSPPRTQENTTPRNIVCDSPLNRTLVWQVNTPFSLERCSGKGYPLKPALLEAHRLVLTEDKQAWLKNERAPALASQLGNFTAD